MGSGAWASLTFEITYEFGLHDRFIRLIDLGISGPIQIHNFLEICQTVLITHSI